ncbi:MAG TPA: PQQ-dependent sugar dehydrogenase [Pyrinomonadaceae bacterium]|nr:PQQ-dependent sugar dehydrogenase [Pyrinomonadaceae bacterium]
MTFIGRRRLLRAHYVCAILLSLLSFTASTRAATLPAGFAETLVAGGLSSPTAMAFAPDGRLFVCQQGGQLRVIKNGTLLATPFLTVTTDASGERGLLGVAFDPNFATNHFVYIYYTVPTSPRHNRVSRFTASGDVAVAGSEVIILELDNLSGATNHNGGAIHFGPDGKLYIAVGENATASNAQTLANLHGKILRINSDGTIPADNPFFNTATGKNRAIWALGLRNPYTFAFQPGTGRMFINDVGQSTWEEINDGIIGSNYGWPTTEGPTTDSRFRPPLFAYQHGSTSTTGCAITGGAFYNPAVNQFPATYVGKYFFADFCGGWIRLMNPANNTASAFATGIAAPVDLQVGPDGNLYYLARGGGGQVFRIRYTANQAPSISTHPASKTVSVGQNATFTVAASGTAPLSYQWQRNSGNIPGATTSSYTLANAQLSDSGAKFRAVVTNSFGSATSNQATLTVVSNQPPAGSITAPAAGTLYRAGDTINYSGTGSDPEDGALPASAFTWRVDFHHDTHVHPFRPPATGSKTGTFTIPNVGETSANVFYRIVLTVKDSDGFTHTATRDVRPRKVALTLASSPPGLQLKLDGQPVTAPISVQSVVGMRRTITAVSPQTVNGVAYQFSSWSDGGAASHTVVTPATNTTYTARFVVLPQRLNFASSAYSVGEGGGSVQLTVTRTNGTKGEVLVDYGRSGGTATEGSDYTRLAGTLRFLDGQTTKTLTLFVTNDALAEGNETVNVTLSSPRGALLGSRKTAIVTITDND